MNTVWGINYNCRMCYPYATNFPLWSHKRTDRTVVRDGIKYSFYMSANSKAAADGIGAWVCETCINEDKFRDLCAET